MPSTPTPNLRETVARYAGQLPVPIVDIANDLGLTIYGTTDLADDESGLIRKEDGKYVVYLNSNHSYARKRFTLAHEIGHFIKHRELLEHDQDIVDRTDQPFTEKPALRRGETDDLDAAARTREWEANAVAAELLMPEEEFRAAWEETNSIEEVAQKFAVSASAATVRGKQLFNAFRA